MNIVFLDIDGVLNDILTKDKTPSGFRGIDDDKVEMLVKICDKLSANIVISSDWRDCLYKRDNDGKYLAEKLLKHGLYIIGIIPTISWSRRGEEIVKYLEAYDDTIDKYLVLDDNEFDFKHIKEVASHVILTDIDRYDDSVVHGIFDAKPLLKNESDLSDEVKDIMKIINNTSK